MKQTGRTSGSAIKRSTSSQVNRPVSSQTRTAQMNRTTDSTAGGAGGETFVNQNVNKQKASPKDQPKDRLGQAVVSLIFGIFGIILFFVSLIKMDYDSTHSYTFSGGTAIITFFAYILNVVGFILGIRARRSSNGRGMAIAGITLTAFPLVIMTLFFVVTLVALFEIWL
jgi:hypothetical protein